MPLKSLGGPTNFRGGETLIFQSHDKGATNKFLGATNKKFGGDK
jgi:hypothetical protein